MDDSNIMDFQIGVYKFGDSEFDKEVKENGMTKKNYQKLKILIMNRNCIRTNSLFLDAYFNDYKWITNGIEYLILPIDEMIEKINNLKKYPDTPYKFIEIKYNVWNKTALAYVYQIDSDSDSGMIKFLTTEDFERYTK